MRWFKPHNYDLDQQIHDYTHDISELMERIDSSTDVDDDTIELLQYNLKIMVMCQQRLLESRE